MTRVVANRERSAGRVAMEWREVPISAAQRRTMEPGTKAYVSDKTKCSLFVSRTPQFGWHLSIAHPWRRPTWDEIAAARYERIPADIVMAMLLPPEDEYVNIHEFCFQLYECRCPR